MFDRIALFRKYALEAESKAFAARTEANRRAWMIVAREWNKMAAEAHVKFLRTKSAPLAPDAPSRERHAAHPEK